MKYGINRINIRLFSQQAEWLGGKRVELHPWGSKNQTLQMTYVVVKIGILIEYSTPT